MERPNLFKKMITLEATKQIADDLINGDGADPYYE